MMRWLWRSRVLRLALTACGAAALVLVWSLRQALPPDDVRAPATMAVQTEPVDDLPRPTGYSLDRVLAAVAKDPFHPERRRPGARFQLPADVAAAMARRRETEGAAASVRVIGTAVASDGGGFAMCAWAGGTPRIVRVGERVGEWTLRRVTPGAAEFTTSTGTTVVARIPKAGT
jgi:hypothetical protein